MKHIDRRHQRDTHPPGSLVPSGMSPSPLHVGRPNIGDADRLLRRVQEIVKRRWLTNQGPVVAEFEARIADHVGVQHCVATCNATMALEIAARAAGLTGEVIVPSYTFVATVHALLWQGITPVFCDIDRETQTIDPTRVEELITPRTTGVVGVHLWGRSCHVEALQEIADRHDLTLIFDAAHAFGSTYRGKKIGGFGRAEVLSFHATKFIQSGEGGAVVTDDEELADRARLMRNFGFAGCDHVVTSGTNGKMNELSGAMGLTSLESMDEFLSVNERNYRVYAEVVSGLPDISLLTFDPTEQSNFHYIVFDVDDAACPLSRDQLLQALHAENVLARRYFYPGVHRMQPYRSLYPNAGQGLPVTEVVARRTIVLPTGTAVTPSDIRRIGDILRSAIAAAPKLRLCLKAELPAGSLELEGQSAMSISDATAARRAA